VATLAYHQWHHLLDGRSIAMFLQSNQQTCEGLAAAKLQQIGVNLQVRCLTEATLTTAIACKGAADII